MGGETEKSSANKMGKVITIMLKKTSIHGANKHPCASSRPTPSEAKPNPPAWVVSEATTKQHSRM